MGKSASARWKRRVGSLHWETTDNDDEFLHFSSYSTTSCSSLDTPTVVETRTAAPEHGTSVRWGLIVISCGWMISVGLLVRRRWHDNKRISATTTTATATTKASLSLGREFPWEQKHGGRLTERQKKDRCETTLMSQLHNAGTATDDNKLQDSESCSPRNEADERSNQVAPVWTDTVPPKESAGNESNAIELVRPETPPLLVADRTEATATACTDIMTVSSTPGLSSFVNDDRTNRVFSLREQRAASMVSRQSIVTAAAAEDATDLAQKIRVTQAVFFQHGLDPNLASEWAMRRQASDLLEASQQKLEDYKFALDTLSRREDRQVSERQLREMRASMEYDKDWLEKIHGAREKCWRACAHSFFLSMVVSLVVETYWNVPENVSAVSLLAYILGCNCEESDMSDPSDDSRTWSMTWFSDYCTGALYYWTPAGLSHLLCYSKCIGWRLLPPSVIQISLHFCRVPTIIHQAVTMATIVSLLSLQLAAVIKGWLWFRVLPLLVVAICSVARVRTLTSYMIDSLQRSQNVRKRLAEALISLDSLHNNVFLAHFCAVGLLLAVSPKLTL